MRSVWLARIVEVAIGVHGFRPLVNQERSLVQYGGIIGGLGHARHAADELPEGTEGAGVMHRFVASIVPFAAIPADERRTGSGQAGALAKAQQQIVIRDIKKEVAGGLKLAFEATVEQLDSGVVEEFEFPDCVCVCGKAFGKIQKTARATCARRSTLRNHAGLIFLAWLTIPIPDYPTSPEGENTNFYG
jgi:hypothetical protein